MAEEKKSNLNWFDRFIGVFSAKAALNRERYRAAASMLRKYEGAAKGRRTESWYASSTSANSEIRFGLVTLRNRSRDLIRNNPYAKKGLKAISGNVVGRGIRANIYAGSDGQKKKIKNVWDAWAYSTQCDFDGKNDFYGLQKLVMEAVVESGEVLVRRRTQPGAAFPLKLQVLESDFINSDLYQSAENGKNRIYQGIEFDQDGRAVAYHLFQEHPGNMDSRTIVGSWKTIRVPAEEICHLFLIERPGQVRGVPWLAPAMLRLRDLDDYEDAQLVRQKIAACFSVFIQDTMDAADAKEKCSLGEKVEPGIIEVLPPGKTVSFASPPPVEGYRDYMSVSLQGIAAGYGLSYEILTGDLSRVNFSSARMGWLEFQRNVDGWRDCLLNPRFNEVVFQWFLSYAQLLGLNIQGVYAQWISPRREMIDPTKEVPAKIMAIRAGIDSLEDAIYQNGKDPEEHLQQIADTNEKLDELGIVLDSDPRKINNSGTLQQSLNNANQADPAEQPAGEGQNGYHNGREIHA